jgi:hypothetical protein
MIPLIFSKWHNMSFWIFRSGFVFFILMIRFTAAWNLSQRPLRGFSANTTNPPGSIRLTNEPSQSDKLPSVKHRWQESGALFEVKFHLDRASIIVVLMGNKIYDCFFIQFHCRYARSAWPDSIGNLQREGTTNMVIADKIFCHIMNKYP